MRFVISALLVAATSVQSLAQQPAASRVLTLDEAIALARRNNPAHLQSRTARDRAGASLRSSYGALIPSVRTSFSGSYREGRPELVGGQAFGSTADIVGTDAALSLSAGYSYASLLAPRVQRSNLDAAEADIAGSEMTLRLNVASQYFTALQAQARAALQDTLLVSVQAQLDLARARAAVGAATPLDVRRAEVQVGTQQVNVLRERNNVEIEKLRLFQQMGVQQPEGVQLSTTFPVAEPTYKLDELLGMARRSNPAMESQRAREKSANLTLRQAQSAYFPSLSLNTSIAGYTSQLTNLESTIASDSISTVQSHASCLTTDSIRVGVGLPSIRADRCDKLVFSEADKALIRAQNSRYPFDFTRNPINFSVSLSLPIFDGLQREQRIQLAAADRNDARYRLRDAELRLTADVTAAYLNLTTAFRTVGLQEQNAAAARDALNLAQERFRVGASSFIDVTQARSDYESASTLLITAIYDFHKAYATLESAIGRPLR